VRKQLLRAGLAVAMATALVLTAAIAFADIKAFEDPDDAAAGVQDIATYKAGHRPKTEIQPARVVHTVTTFESFRAQKDKNIVIHLNAFKKTNGEKVRTQYRISGDGQITPVTEGQGEPSIAKVTRPDDHTIRIIFSKDAIGHPDYYKWHVLVDQGHAGKGCTGGICDRAPDAGNKTHTLNS
jgi:hypothetical protein